MSSTFKVMKRSLGLLQAGVEEDVKKEIIEPLREEAEALVNTLPLELGMVNSVAGKLEYQVDVTINEMGLDITPAPGSVAEWMEEGKDPWNVAAVMLNRGKVKHTKEGKRYKDVPINSSKLHDARSPRNELGSIARRPLTSHGKDKFRRKVDSRVAGGDNERLAMIQQMREDAIREVEETARQKGVSVKSTTYQDREVKIRRISDDTVREGKWEHPGFEGRHVLAAVENVLNQRLDEMVAAWGAEPEAGPAHAEGPTQEPGFLDFMKGIFFK